jgi:protein-tyrosine phosphatase
VLAVRRLRAGAARRFHSLQAAALELGAPKLPKSPDEGAEYSVLFVCHGNICRSPIAEGVLRRQLSRAGVLDRVMIDSAGTSGVNAGRRPDGRARASSRRHGGNIGDLRARAFADDDFDNFDLILLMDESNRRDVLRRARIGADAEKVQMLLDYAGGGEIPDPLGGTRADFERAYDAIEAACWGLSESIRRELETGRSRSRTPAL